MPGVGTLLLMTFVFFMVSSEDRNEIKKQEMRNKCYQLTEVQEVYPSTYACMKDRARKKSND